MVMKAWIRIDEAQRRSCVEVHHPGGEIGAAAAATLTGPIVVLFCNTDSCCLFFARWLYGSGDLRHLVSKRTQQGIPNMHVCTVSTRKRP